MPMQDLPAPRPWRRLASEPGPDLYLFRARFDTLENPGTGRAMVRVVLETPDWVNVIALTPDRRVIFVRQFRFGAGAVTTEIPAGMVDPGEGAEAAARRELLEETGYASDRWTDLGSVEPNPAFHTNRCHHFLAEDCRYVQEPTLDGGEDIVVATLDLDTVRQGILDGSIDHSLVVSAFSRVLDLRRRPL